MEFGHEMHLAAALKDVDALPRCLDRVAVKIGGALLKLREVFHALHCSLRAEETLDVDAAERGGIDAMPVFVRADVADGVSGRVCMAVGVAVKTGHALVREKAAAVFGGVELGLRKRRDQQPQAFGQRFLLLMSSGDMAASFSQVMSLGSRTRAPSCTGFPRDMVTPWAERSARS